MTLSYDDAKTSILIVEDSPTQAEQLKELLQNAGYRVTLATDGREALSLIETTIPNLVISDIVMPDIDGYTLCRNIKQNERFNHIPVILVTSLYDLQDVIRGLESGANNFIIKPYHEKHLLSRIENVLSSSHTEDNETNQTSLDITLKGEKIHITSSRRQILNILLSTYETAIVKNQELFDAKKQLRIINENLEEEIQERIRAEEIIIESEKRYRTISELAEDSIYIFNQDYSIAYVNTYATQFFNISQTNQTNIHMKEIFPMDIEDQFKKQLDLVFSTRQNQRFTILGSLHENDFWLDTIFVPIISVDDEVVQVIALSRDITIKVLFEKEMEKKGIIQIEKNMEQFQILNDKIRNPLSVIMSAASFFEGKESDIIIEQVKLIDELVTQLDHGWIESEKVRSFLIKHYGHGKEID